MDLSPFDDWVKRLIRGLGYEEFTNIQEKVLPELCQSSTSINDVLIAAPTGSGKTFAYSIPILQALNRDKYGVYALVILPTRELALQVEEQIKIFGRPIDVGVLALVGGFERHVQLKKLKSRPNICIGTPGRILDVITSDGDAYKIFKNLQYVVLDEADNLLKDNHRDAVESIMRCIPTAGQGRKMIMCSATINKSTISWRDIWLSHRAENLVISCADDTEGLMEISHDIPWKIGGLEPQLLEAEITQIKNDIKSSEPIRLFEVGSAVLEGVTESELNATSPDTLDHYMMMVPPVKGLHPKSDNRLPYLVYLLESHVKCQGTQILDREEHEKKLGVYKNKEGKRARDFRKVKKRDVIQGIVFVDTMKEAEVLSRTLSGKGLMFDCVPLHAGLEQRERVKNLNLFKGAKKLLLIATDIAARGLDMPNVAFVINYKMPREPDKYIHRAGRAGRAGRRGHCISFVTCEDEGLSIEMVEEVLQKTTKTSSEFEIQELPDVDEDLIGKKLNRIMECETEARISLRGYDAYSNDRGKKRTRYDIEKRGIKRKK